MLRRLAPALALVLTLSSLLAPPARAETLKTDEEKTLYALGLLLGGNVKNLGLTKEEYAKVRAGIDDAALGKKPQVELQTWGPKVQACAKKHSDEAAEKEAAKEKEQAKGFAREPGAQAFPSGLVYKKLKDGSGPQPAASSKVKVNYEGKLLDGTVFDSSYARNEPASFPLNGVIPCWTEGVQKMKVGEKAQLVCPSTIAYGPAGHPPTIPGGATLVFTVELLAIEQ